MYRLLLKIAVYLLPFPAFEIGWRMWSLSVSFLVPLFFTFCFLVLLVLFPVYAFLLIYLF